MNERPIIFNSEMVKAILEGRKTQTRRVIKDVPDCVFEGQPCCHSWPAKRANSICSDCWQQWLITNRYGVPGDKLWVRETWASTFISELAPGEWIGKSKDDCYRDNEGYGCPAKDGIVYRADADVEHPLYGKPRWRSPMHMFRWASRISLEITNIKVERVQDIAEDDARAEGCKDWIPCGVYTGIKGCKIRGGAARKGTHKEYFELLWNSINKKKGYGWDENPWVWVVEFKTLTPKE